MNRAVAGAGLVLVVLAAHLYLPSQISALAAETIRSLHAPGFGLVAILVLRFGRFSGGVVSRYGKAALVSSMLAVLAELAQIPGAREAELADLVADSLGIIGFLGCAAILDREMRGAIGIPGAIALAFVSIPAFGAATAPTGWLAYALWMRQQALPILLSFDNSWERAYTAIDEVGYTVIPALEGWPPGSGNIARLQSAGRFGFLLRFNPYPDWSKFVAISFVAGTAGDESRYLAYGLWGLRPANGSPAGRYYDGVRIGPVPQRYCILFEDLPDASSDRPFDLRIVSELLFAAANKEVGVTVYVDDFRLESSTNDCSRH